MKRIKDTDYLEISARIRAMENRLLTRERMERVLEARTDEDVIRILQECGYPELSHMHPETVEAALSSSQEAMLADLDDALPDTRYLDIFKLKYDYHNVKVVLKAQAMGIQPDRMLMDLGRIDAEELRKAVEEHDWKLLPNDLAAAAREADEILNTTRDPQLCDVVLDRWLYREMKRSAEETGSAFLQGYVKMQIDTANLRMLVRTIRMGKNAEFLRGILLENGGIAANEIIKVSAGGGSGLMELYGTTRFSAAAEAGKEILHGGSMTEFERLCDDAVSSYLTGAQFVSFGEAPLLGYLAARETEYTNLRILLLGHRMGLPADVIRSRLRASYV